MNTLNFTTLHTSPIVRGAQAFLSLLAFSLVASGVHTGGYYGGSLSFLILITVLTWLMAMALCVMYFIGEPRVTLPSSQMLLIVDGVAAVVLILAAFVGATSDMNAICAAFGVFISCSTIRFGLACTFFASFAFMATLYSGTQAGKAEVSQVAQGVKLGPQAGSEPVVVDQDFNSIPV